MHSLLILSLQYLLYLIYVSAQSFENPGINSTISCGLTAKCNIICNSANSCQTAEFYLYSNEVYIECSGESSCRSLKIISTNATSLILHMNGSNAFHFGIAFIQQSNQHIITRCFNHLACSEASFYYNGIGQTVNHYCNQIRSCQSSLISAIPINSIHLICGATFACSHMDIYTPMNVHNTSIIHNNASTVSIHIYSMHGLYNLNITCNEHCININDIYVVYGKEYQSYCAIYDITCMQSTSVNNIAFGNDENKVVIYNDANYQGIDLNEPKVVLFVLRALNNNSFPNLITITPSSSSIHVICVDQSHYPVCDNIHFNFSASTDAVITANNAHFVTITGPANDFKRIAYRNNNDANQYHLQTTPFISLQCNQLEGGQCLSNSALYTTSPAKLLILCGTNDCHYSDIYTSYNPLETVVSLGDSGFNIICYPSNTSCNVQFLLHFSGNITCSTPRDPNCVGFLASSNPTISPTSTPSMSPSIYPTEAPTISPLQSPSLSPSTSPIMIPTLSPSFTPSLAPSIYPTTSPTIIPSLSPTVSPSMSPSVYPSLSPSASPSISPSVSPSISPSVSPSMIPTLNPSMAPSKSPSPYPTSSPTPAPTHHPTSMPSISPTFSPSDSPTLPPTNNPSLSPSISPTQHPTLSPTRSPSVAPTVPPTNAPTQPPTHSPTRTPTAPPTRSPSVSPTTSPTHVPTRYPTQDIYTHTIYIDYTLTNITNNISIQLWDPIAQTELEEIFEQCYLLTSYALIPDKNKTLHYKDFNVDIAQVETHPSIIHVNYTALIKAEIYYEDASVGDTIRFISRRIFFQNLTQYKLRHYFQYYGLLLAVGDPWEKGDDNISKSVAVQGFFLFIVSIGFVCTVLAVSSFIYNNWPVAAWTDNANSIAIPLYGLQMVDFFTDINLCVEMFLQFKGSKYETKRVLLYTATWGAFIFTLIPYITNLALAAGIKNVKEIKNNPFARSYFQTSSWFFIVLVVFSGAVYPALSIVSCRLFAFEFLNSGLTMMELTLLTRWRLHLTICLENIPQLICSVIYILYLGTPSNNTILSMIMSTLQIIATVTNFIVMYRPSDCRAIQYDLQMEIKPDVMDILSKSHISTSNPRLLSKENLKSFTTSVMDMDDDEESDDDEYESAIHRKYYDIFDVDPASSSILTTEQKTQIRQRKECKASLRRSLCTELSLRLNSIEIGYITLTPNGCIIHIIHYVFESEAKAFRDTKLLKKRSIPKSMDSDDMDLEQIGEQTALKSPSLSWTKSDGRHDRWDGDLKLLGRTANALFKDLYRRNSDQAECALASHFGFKQELISVTYHRRYPYTSWEMMKRDHFSYQSMKKTQYQKLSQDIPHPKPDNIEIVNNVSNVSNAEDGSMRSPTDELQESTNQILQILMVKIREKLMHKDKDTVKVELLEEGFKETLIDQVFEMGQLLAQMTQANGAEEPEDKIENGEDGDDDDQENDRKDPKTDAAVVDDVNDDDVDDNVDIIGDAMDDHDHDEVEKKNEVNKENKDDKKEAGKEGNHNEAGQDKETMNDTRVTNDAKTVNETTDKQHPQIPH